MKLLATITTLTPILFIGTMAQTNQADRSPASIEKFGWTSVPHAQSTLLKDVSPWDPANYTAAEIKIPDSELAKKTMQYAKDHLPEIVFNHSMRAYYYGPPISTPNTS
jgi:cyanamide hydratase